MFLPANITNVNAPNTKRKQNQCFVGETNTSSRFQVGINRALFELVELHALIMGDAGDEADDVVGDSGGMY